jgi:hypothetical protein
VDRTADVQKHYVQIYMCLCVFAHMSMQVHVCMPAWAQALIVNSRSSFEPDSSWRKSNTSCISASGPLRHTTCRNSATSSGSETRQKAWPDRSLTATGSRGGAWPLSTFNCGRCCSCLSLDVFRCLRKMCMFTIPFACGCRYTCVCVCVAHMSMHAHMHVHVCVCVSEHTCVLLLFHVHVSMCTYRYTCVCVCCAYAACMRIYMCMRACACVHVALYNQSLRTCKHAPIAYSSEAHVATHYIHMRRRFMGRTSTGIHIKKNNIRKMRDPLCSGSRTRPSR